MTYRIAKLVSDYVSPGIFVNRLELGDSGLGGPVDLRFIGEPGWIENAHSIWFSVDGRDGYYPANTGGLITTNDAGDLVFFDPSNEAGRTLTQLYSGGSGGGLWELAADDEVQLIVAKAIDMQTQKITGLAAGVGGSADAARMGDLDALLELDGSDPMQGNLSMASMYKVTDMIAGVAGSADAARMADLDALLELDGSDPMQGNLSMGTHKITNLSAGVAGSSDAARMSDLEAYLKLTGVYAMQGDLDMGNHDVINTKVVKAYSTNALMFWDNANGYQTLAQLVGGGGASLWEIDGGDTQLIAATDIDMQTQKIKNLAAGVAGSGDSARMADLDALLELDGSDPMQGNLSMASTYKVTDMIAGVVGSADAARMADLDALLELDGSDPMQGNLSMGTHKITNLAAGTPGSSDAARMSDIGGGSGLWEVDGTETQLITADDIDMRTQKIKNLAAGVGGSADAARMADLDALLELDGTDPMQGNLDMDNHDLLDVKVVKAYSANNLSFWDSANGTKTLSELAAGGGLWEVSGTYAQLHTTPRTIDMQDKKIITVFEIIGSNKDPVTPTFDISASAGADLRLISPAGCNTWIYANDATAIGASATWVGIYQNLIMAAGKYIKADSGNLEFRAATGSSVDHLINSVQCMSVYSGGVDMRSKKITGLDYIDFDNRTSAPPTPPPGRLYFYKSGGVGELRYADNLGNWKTIATV